MPNTIMQSTDFRSEVAPILNRWFDGVYDLRKDEYKQIFDVFDGIERSYEEQVVGFGMQAAPLVPDGDPTPYSGGGQFYAQRYWYYVYGLAFALTKVLVEDGDHIRIGTSMSRHLAQSLIDTKETITANVLNRGFNSSYVGGDGVEFFSTAHPLMIGGTFSNELATPAALSRTSLEQLLIQISQAVDNTNKPIHVEGKKLVVPPALVFQAETILKSVLQPDNANNAVNAINSMGLLPDGVAKITRLTSSTAWFVKTDASQARQFGLNLIMRRNVEKSMEGDFDTDSMRYKATERYAAGWTDPRCAYASSGA